MCRAYTFGVALSWYRTADVVGHACMLSERYVDLERGGGWLLGCSGWMGVVVRETWDDTRQLRSVLKWCEVERRCILS